MPALRDGQVQKFINVLGAVQIHGALPQLLALTLADDIAAERGELHRDFFLGHWISRITFGHIDASGMRFAVFGCDGYPTRLELGKERFEFFVGDDLDLVHDWNE